MTASDIVPYRLINQHIAETKFKKPEEIVSYLVAMQAQDFAMAKWSIGLRLPGLFDGDIEKAFNEGLILRTHLMRPTWHFVTPADIRWLLKLTAPHVNAFNAYWYRKRGLDAKIFKRSNDILVKNLEGGKQLTRATLKSALERSKIAVSDGERLGSVMMHAELDGIICSGGREGKQFTYALLDERVPLTNRNDVSKFDREEVLAQLMNRYFASRGPATVQDFVWWSGINIKEAKAGVTHLKKEFIHEIVNGQEYIFAPTKLKTIKPFQSTFLMADYDEYGISYKDRSAIFSDKKIRIEGRGGNILFNHMIIIDGLIAGTWKRTVKNRTVEIETATFVTLSKMKQQAVKNAVKRYHVFFERNVSGESKQRKKR